MEYGTYLFQHKRAKLTLPLINMLVVAQKFYSLVLFLSTINHRQKILMVGLC